jgi:cytochrome c
VKPHIISVALAAAFVAAIGARSASAAPDAAHGELIFKQTCGVCHSGEIGVNKIGPSLFGVVGRPIGSLPDYVYSEKLKSMRASWGKWDDTTLDTYLFNPRVVLHGVKMYFKGLPDGQDRADVIAYLRSLK